MSSIINHKQWTCLQITQTRSGYTPNSHTGEYEVVQITGEEISLLSTSRNLKTTPVQSVETGERIKIKHIDLNAYRLARDLCFSSHCSQIPYSAYNPWHLELAFNQHTVLTLHPLLKTF